MTKIQWIILLVFLLATGTAAVITILLRRKRQQSIEEGETKVDNLTDFHCHILPGVDDGSKDMDMTMEMLDLSYAQGVRRIIATPHYHRGHVENEPEKLREVLKKVQEKAAKKYPDLEIRLGNEVFYSDGVIDLLRKGKFLPMGAEDSRYLLVEFSPDDSFSRLQDAVSQVTRMGYRPVIAHVERYQCMYRQKDRFEELQRQGALFQVNYNQARENRWLFQHDFVDLLATDCHNTEERAPKIEENLKNLFTFCSREQIEKILKTNPDRIWLSGKTSLL